MLKLVESNTLYITPGKIWIVQLLKSPITNNVRSLNLELKPWMAMWKMSRTAHAWKLNRKNNENNYLQGEPHLASPNYVTAEDLRVGSRGDKGFVRETGWSFTSLCGLPQVEEPKTLNPIAATNWCRQSHFCPPPPPPSFFLCGPLVQPCWHCHRENLWRG